MITFRQIRNATIKLQYPGVTFMVDPWLMDVCDPVERDVALSERRFIPKPACPLPDKAEELIRDVDAYLLTHFHSDHFSSDYLPSDAPIICQDEADAGELKALGFSNVKWFREDPVRIGDVTVHRVEALHGDNEETVEEMGKGSGYVFVCDGEKTVYVAGDTVYYEGVAKVIDSFRPDVIIVNACDARWETGRLIMDAEDVKKTCDAAPESLIIASHMDTVTHAHLSRQELKEELAGTRYSRVLIPEDGERVEF